MIAERVLFNANFYVVDQPTAHQRKVKTFPHRHLWVKNLRKYLQREQIPDPLSKRDDFIVINTKAII